MAYLNSILFDVVKLELGTREISSISLKTLAELLRMFTITVNMGNVLKDKAFIQENSKKLIFYQDGKENIESELDFSKEIVILEPDSVYCSFHATSVHTLYLYLPN